jgi:hypothetical protein
VDEQVGAAVCGGNEPEAFDVAKSLDYSSLAFDCCDREFPVSMRDGR